MAVEWEVASQVAGAVAGAIVGWGLGRASERRSKLIAYYGHVGAFQLSNQPGQPNPGRVHTHQVVIRNVGRSTARNVRFYHHYLPDYNLFPSQPHSVVDVPGSGRQIVVDALVPGEQLTVNYLYFEPITFDQVNAGIKSDDGFAKPVPVLLRRQVPPWARRLAYTGLAIGAMTVMYFIALAMRALWRLT